MKTISRILFIWLFLLSVTAGTLNSCKKENLYTGGDSTNLIPPPPPPSPKVNPSNPNALTSALIIDNSTLFKGDIPGYLKPPGNDSIFIGGIQNSVEVSAGGELIIPFNYFILAGQTYTATEYYIQVVGADSTFKIKPSAGNNAQNGTRIQRIGIPSRISFGSFCFKFSTQWVNADGSGYGQSAPVDICVNISAPKTCGQMVTGYEGLTFTSLTLGNTAGQVNIDYDTYSIPDRIDVYYNKLWVAGTGTDLGPVPPQKNCYDVVPGDGFIGASNTLSFAYDPSVSKNVTVVVSGCLGSNTGWEYTVNCP
jgi:hypothetical protein